MGLLDRIAPRRADVFVPPQPAMTAGEGVFATKALSKFLTTLTSHESPILLDLGPVIGPNVNFFGEQLGCKIFVEDIFGDVDRHVREDKVDVLPDYLKARFRHPDESIDGVLCWDVMDYLDRPSAQHLAAQLTRILRPGGSLLGFFGTAQPREARYTKYLILDDVHLKHRPVPAARGRQAALLNRDIIRLFPGLRVSDSFLLKNNLREILFRKPV